MLVNAIDGIVQNGQIRLREQISLAENTKVYVIVADLSAKAPPLAYIRSPRLAHPEQAADFRKQVLELSDNAQL
jgi:hypothetical protein